MSGGRGRFNYGGRFNYVSARVGIYEWRGGGDLIIAGGLIIALRGSVFMSGATGQFNYSSARVGIYERRGGDDLIMADGLIMSPLGSVFIRGGLISLLFTYLYLRRY